MGLLTSGSPIHLSTTLTSVNSLAQVMALLAVLRCCPFLLRIPLRGTLDDLEGIAKGTGWLLTS